MVFPTPPLPPTKIQLRDCCSTTFRRDGSGRLSKSSSDMFVFLFVSRVFLGGVECV